MSDSIVIEPLSQERLRSSIDQFVAVARDVPGEYWEARHFLLDLQDKWSLSLAVWQAGRPVGYAIMSRKSKDTAHLHHFMIVGSQRGQGLGGQLLAAAMDRCRLIGCARLSLKVSVANAAAVRFYRRHGFADAGDDAGYKSMTRRWNA